MIVKCKNFNLVVNRDWLQYSGQLKLDRKESVTDPEMCCPEGYKMEILTGTTIFNYRATIHNSRGVKVLTLLWGPKAKWLNRRLIQFEISNNVLYSNELNEILMLTYEIHNYTFLCISRVDLCCDFELSTSQRRIITYLYKGKYYVASKNEGSIWWSKDIGEPYPHQLTYGSKKSDFKWKLYNKSKELKIGTKNPDKPYIWEEWDAAGMNITNVWRLEVSITKGSGFRVNGRRYEIEDVVSDAYVLGTYGDLLKKRFVIRKNQKHSRKSNDEIVELIKYPFDNVLTSTMVYDSKPIEASVGTHLNKICEVLESTEVLSAPILLRQLSITLVGMVAKYNLGSYFFKVHGMSVLKYIQSLDGMQKSQIIDRKNKETYAMIGDRLNSCWLRKLWLEKRQKVEL